MNNTDFKAVLSAIPGFSSLQFRLLKENVQARIKKKRVSHILETESYNVKCPFCSSKNFIKWGRRTDMQRYRCKSCKRTFNSLTKTPLARLQRKGHWLKYAHCLKYGFTLTKSAEICGIHISTAFRWRHRFLTNMKQIKAKKVGGVVENGHLKLKESFKGNRRIECNREYRDVFVLYGIDANNNIFDATDKSCSLDGLKEEFKSLFKLNSLMIARKGSVYYEFAKSLKIQTLDDTSNTMFKSLSGRLESYKSEFTSWIYDHFKGVATKYLENYVSWFRLLNEFKAGPSALTILYRAKSVEKYRHQPEKVKRFL